MKSTLAKTLRRWRRLHRLTQAQAAAQLGRSLRTYQEWEQGRSFPRGAALSALLQQITQNQTNGH